MNGISKTPDFNPSGVGLKNGNFIGLPFNEETANFVLVPVPWDVTVSFGEGTALGPQAILDASVQLDLFDPDVPDAWKIGIYFQPVSQDLLNSRTFFRKKAVQYIDFIENGGHPDGDPNMRKILDELNNGCDMMNKWVYQETKKLIDAGKNVGIIGGDHSVPFGYLNALGKKYKSFGILQVDAHQDLRKSYEGFTWSHASIFYNLMQQNYVSKLVQIGIRDFCDEEMEFVEKNGECIKVFSDAEIKENHFVGQTWDEQCGNIIDELPELVYISFDIDGLDSKLCPHTGTPVPGGFDLPEVFFLFKKLIASGRKIIGFDLCETGDHPWDANVGARIAYKLCNLSGLSKGLV
jgi:agmatinase